MDDSTIEEIIQIRGVHGAALLDASGTIVIARMDQPELEILISRMSAVAEIIGGNGAFGDVTRVTLRTETNDDLSLFIRNDQAMAVLADRLRPATMLGEDVRRVMG
ncbi:MAG: hypothetical protein ACI8TX_001676 [Hyphomicrobiaceae bacterium]|jgi:hypothetical protein